MNLYLRKVLRSIWKARKATRRLDFKSNVGKDLIQLAWATAYRDVADHIGVKELSFAMQPTKYDKDDYPARLLRVVTEFERTSLNDAIVDYVAASKAAEQIRIAADLGLVIPDSITAQLSSLHFDAMESLTRFLHIYRTDWTPYPLEEIERILTLANEEREQKEHALR